MCVLSATFFEGTVSEFRAENRIMFCFINIYICIYIYIYIYHLRRFTSLCSDLTPFRFKCTWFEIKSRDMNEKGKDFIFYNKPYAFSRSSWSIAYGHGVCTLDLTLLPAPTPALDLHAHTQWHCLLLLEQRGGGVHVLK